VLGTSQITWAPSQIDLNVSCMHLQTSGQIRARSRPPTYPPFACRTDCRALLECRSAEGQTLLKRWQPIDSNYNVQGFRKHYRDEENVARPEPSPDQDFRGTRRPQTRCRADPVCDLHVPFSAESGISFTQAHSSRAWRSPTQTRYL